MDYFEGLRKLADGLLPACLAIEGEEPYLIEDFLQKMKEHLLPSGSESLNLTRLEGDSFDMETLQSSLGTLSLFGDKRLVIVKNAQSIKWTPEMKRYLKEEAFEDVSMAFVLDKDTGSAKTIRSLMPTLHCKRIDRRQMIGWIRKEARLAGKELSNEAIHDIVERSRYFEYRSKISLFMVKGELDKLLSTSEELIDVRRVQAMFTIPAEERIFDMVEAITEARGERAIELYAHFKEAGEISYILLLLIKNYEQLLIAKTYAESSQSIESLGMALGLTSGFVLRKIQRHALAYPIEDLREALELCLHTLHQSHLETRDMSEVVENLILQLLQLTKKEKET